MRHKLLEEMKELVGKKEPVLFFKSMIDVFEIIFDKLESIEEKLNRPQVSTSNEKANLIAALSIKWDPKIALLLLAQEIEKFRENKTLYHTEISAFKDAYAQNIVTQDYDSFVTFWQNIVGEHPFST